MPGGFASPAPPRVPGLAWLAGQARAQRWLWAEVFALWTGRALPSAIHASALGDGRRFAARRGPWMGTLVPLVVFSQFVDVLVCQGALHLAAPPAWRWPLHALLLVVSLWLVAWAVALRSATRSVDHVLGDDTLTLAIGVRQLCRLPLAAIASATVIDHRAARRGQDWLDVHGLTPSDVTLLAAMDRPTLLLALRPGAPDAWCARDGTCRPLQSHVAVYVDEPATLAAALVARPGRRDTA